MRKKNVIAKRIIVAYKMERYAGLLDAIKELADKGKNALVQYFKDNYPDIYETVSKWSDDLQTAFSNGLKQIETKLQAFNQYMDKLPYDKQESIIDALDHALEPILGPNAIEICSGTYSIGKAIIQYYQDGVPPQVWNNICIALDMVANESGVAIAV